MATVVMCEGNPVDRGAGQASLSDEPRGDDLAADLANRARLYRAQASNRDGGTIANGLEHVRSRSSLADYSHLPFQQSERVMQRYRRMKS